jgi:hypothetical protein
MTKRRRRENGENVADVESQSEKERTARAKQVFKLRETVFVFHRALKVISMVGSRKILQLIARLHIEWFNKNNRKDF